MRKFTVGLLTILVASAFATSPVSASVKKITMAVPAKKTDTKKTVSKDNKPIKATIKNADKEKTAAKKTTSVKTVTSIKEKVGKASTKNQGKSDVVNHGKNQRQSIVARQSVKTTSTKTAATKQQALAKTAAQHPSKKTGSVTTKTPHVSAYTQPVALNTYRQPISPVHTASAEPLSAFTTSGGSFHSESTFKITVPQSASVTPPISSFGKSSSMPATFNTSPNASLPSQRPIYVDETPNGPETRAKAALVLDENNLKILYERNSTSRMSMASITKLMTALVVVETMQDMNQVLEISDEDIDRIKGTGSRLKIGTRLTRREMLHLALMSSENRAASALGRYYPGGREAFVNAMNLKAAILGMTNTRYVDTNGLSPQNVSCARDLAKLVMAAAEHPLIRKYSTAEYHTVYDGEKNLSYGSTNRLTHSSNWKIQVQKTGYIREAGQCLVMKTTIDGRPIVMVLLNVVGPKGARIADAQQIKNWLTHSNTSSSSLFSSNRTSSNRNTSFSEDDFYN